MRISTKSFKAIEAVLDVAMFGARKPVTLAEIGKRRRISLSYLEQMFRRLREHGLVRSTRGPGGGYRLNRPLSAISIADIVGAVDVAPPGDNPADARRHGGASTSAMACGLWAGLNDHLQDYLRSVTLESLIGEAGEEESAVPPRLPQAGASLHRLSAPAAGGSAMGVIEPYDSSTRNSAFV